MGNRDDGSGEAVEVLFEPLDGLGVQVVCWFIEEEEVGVAEEEFTEGDAAFFAPGEGGDFPVHGGDTEGVGGDFDAAVEFPEVEGVDFVLINGLFGDDGVHLFWREVFAEFHVEFVIAVKNRLGFCDALLDALADGGIGVEAWLLGKVADLDAFGGLDFAGVAFVFAREDAEEGRFSCAVVAEDADLGAWVEGEPDLLEDDFFVINAGEVFDLIDVLRSHGCSVILGSRGGRVRMVGRDPLYLRSGAGSMIMYVEAEIMS